MKIRKGYVGNSSSCSFCIDKSVLSVRNINQLLNHAEIADEEDLFCKDEPWAIWELEDIICGDTSMDNFDMEEYMIKKGIPMEHVKWDTYNHYPTGTIVKDLHEIIAEIKQGKRKVVRKANV